MRRPVRLVSLLAVCSLAGCAYSMVAGDGLREEAFRNVVARTAAVRGLPAPQSIPTRVISRDEMPAVVRKVISHEWSDEQIADYQDGLVAIGLWPGDRELVEEYLAVSREEVAGLYMPQDRTLYVVRDVPRPFWLRVTSSLLRRDLYLEFVLAHELVHRLQHETHPGLFEERVWRSQDDAADAISAALEGDATRYGLAALLPDDAELPEPAALHQQLEADLGANGDALERAPALLRLTLSFPYSRGYALSAAEGPELLERPPASTEQVLHAERRREPFLALDLSPLRSRLPAGCRAISENDLGELGISVLLRDLGEGVPGVGPEAWEGWDGDRYLAARCGGRREFVWWTAWDSAGDADEFERAYAAVAEAVRERAGLSGVPTTRREERTVCIASPGLAALGEALEEQVTPRRVESLAELRASLGGEGVAR